MSETQDSFMGARLQLLQPREGHRVGTDAALLAACIPPLAGGTLFDLGAGVGAAGLAIALHSPSTRIVLVEIEPAIAALARRNVALNDLAGRVEVIEADVTSPKSGLQANQADTVAMNPPFHNAGSVRDSPKAYRRLAHVAGTDAMEPWIRRAASLLRPSGILVMIHRADALPRLLTSLGRRFGDIRVVPVHPRERAGATRILLRGRKGSRAPFAILPPLVLHGEDGAFTARADALHRGEAWIDWQD